MIWLFSGLIILPICKGAGMNNEKIMCKDCEHFRIEKPDKCNEGHAYCLKYNLSTMLIGKQYKRKIDRLECYKYEIENAEQLKAGGDDENTNQKEN